MANDILVDIFEQCVNRLAQGETDEDCARSYPRYANDIRVMLEATQILRRAQASDREVMQAQARVETRFEQALRQPVLVRRRYPFKRVASILLVVLFVSSLLTTGVVVVAQDSLPGDNLYGVKRFSEQVRLSFASDSTDLEITFAQRRFDEINQLFDLEREVDVQFTGVVEAIEEASILLAGIRVQLSEDLRTIELIQGMRVTIYAKTQLNRSVLATNIQILETREINPQPNIIPPTSTLTATPIVTDIQPSPTDTLRPTTYPRSTDAPTQRPTATHTQRTRNITAQSQVDTPTETCGTPPEGWMHYTIQRGDTPSEVAVATGLSLDEFYAANCDMNPNFVVGDVVFVPHTPRFAATVTGEPQRPTFENIIITANPIIRPTETQREPSRPTATQERQRNNSNNARQNSRDRNNNENDNEGGNEGRGR